MAHEHRPPSGGLPAADAAGRARHERLEHLLREAITQAGGVMDFETFMDRALYTPELGYYMSSAPKFGAEGDFVTAPELSPLFAAALARFCAPVLDACPDGDVVEVGGGSGALAVSLLTALQALGRLPRRYVLVEKSPALIRAQQARVRAQPPAIAERVVWEDRLPTAVRGVLLANELLDALPCRRFVVQAGVAHELGVCVGAQGFGWAVLPPAAAPAQALVTQHRLEEGYVSEWPAAASAWVAQAGAALVAGALLLIDYGFPASEFYHPDRRTGTLMCHYRHHSHTDPLIAAGLQDITVHLDFSALAEAGAAAGLRVAGYTTQAAFLLDCGLTEALAAQTDPARRRRATQAVKILTMPSEMGELFKVLWFTRGLTTPLPGLGLRDLRPRL